MAPTLPLSAAGSLALCLDIDCEAGLEIDGEGILESPGGVLLFFNPLQCARF